MKTSRIFYRLIALASIGALLFSFLPSRTPQVDAQTATPLTGFGWSAQTGWMQLSGAGYAVTTKPVSTTRIDLGGYAWTSTLGWISFESASVNDCPSDVLASQSGITSCAPYVDMTGTGPYRVRGFARACAVFESGCSGPTKVINSSYPTELGGWDGYISLNSGNGPWGWRLSADKTKITGYAWGDQVIGWLDVDVTCTNCNIPPVPEEFKIRGCVDDTTNYIPTFDWSTSPEATSCTLRRTEPLTGAGSVTVNGGIQKGYIPTGLGFQVPLVGAAKYRLDCTKSGVDTQIGVVESVGRCAVPVSYCPDGVTPIPANGICPEPEPLCPGKTFKASEAEGSCLCTDGVTPKSDTAGTNCPTSTPKPKGRPIIIEI